MGHSFFIGAMFLVYLRFLYRLPGLSAITPLSATMIRTAPSKKMQHGKKRKGNAVMVIMYLGPTETNWLISTHHWKKIIPESNINTENRKRSSSSHPFSGVNSLLLSGRVVVVSISCKLGKTPSLLRIESFLRSHHLGGRWQRVEKNVVFSAVFWDAVAGLTHSP